LGTFVMPILLRIYMRLDSIITYLFNIKGYGTCPILKQG
jgi:hypothetical protein